MKVQHWSKGFVCSLLLLPVFSVQSAVPDADSIARAEEYKQHRDRVLTRLSIDRTRKNTQEGLVGRTAGAPSVLRAKALPSVAFSSANDPEYPTYQVLDLGTLGGESTVAVDINDAGQVAGDSETAEGYAHVFLYEDGLMMDLNTLTKDGSSLAAAINARGDVIGSGPLAAFIYRDGEMIDLQSPAGGLSHSNAINDRRQVVGNLQNVPPDSSSGFLYTPDRGFTGLLFPGDVQSSADAINNAGDVAGSYTDATGTHAYLYRRGVRVNLLPWNNDSRVTGKDSLNERGDATGTYVVDGTVHGFLYRRGQAIDIGGDRTVPAALNDRDEVTGSSIWSEVHAFVYSRGELHDIGTLGGDFSSGNAINNRGDVTGFSRTETRMHAFVYRDGEMIDLGPGATTFATGDAINKWGQVAGSYEALRNDGNPPDIRGFIATPVPHLFRLLRQDADRLDHGRLLAWAAGVAQHFYADRDLETSCRVLTEFDRYLRELKSKSGRTTEATKTQVLARSAAIEDVLGCK